MTLPGPRGLLQAYREFTEQASPWLTTRPERVTAVAAQIERTGSYRLTPAELDIGCKLAWRNHARCNGRLHWRSLRLRDRRHVTDPDAVANECIEHLREATNGGAIRATITVFAPAHADGNVAVLNPQLVTYAGYRDPASGSVVGDPMNADLTATARRLGWSGPGGRFDVLPLVLRSAAGAMFARDIPPDAYRQVRLAHPDFPGLARLGLQWYSTPSVSNRVLSIGGIEFPLAPFSGWYVASEVSARDLVDAHRYDLLAEVAQAMGLDTRRDATLWRDRAVVELTYAVQESFAAAGVLMIDHHKAANQFLQHCTRERAAGRDVPADWSWVNPPISASTTATFCRAFTDDPAVRPNFLPRGSRPSVA